jgi:hypothetical protein
MHEIVPFRQMLRLCGCKVIPYCHADAPGDIYWRVRTKLETTELSFIIKGLWRVEEQENIEANVYSALIHSSLSTYRIGT